MNFCKECGRERTKNALYCKHCGARTDEERASGPAARYQRAMTRKRIITMAAIAACLILLFAGYKTGEALTSKEKLISEFEAALDQEDAKKAAKLLQSSDVDLTVTEKNVKPLLDYLKEHPDEEKELITSLKSGTGHPLMTIEKKGRRFLIYDRYVLNTAPVYLTVKTNYKDTGLFVNGEKVITTEKENFEKKIGPFVPGIYEVKAKLKNGVADLEKAEKVAALQGDVKVNADLDGHMAKVVFGEGYENLKGTLWINDQEMKINPFKGTEFGPVLTDGSMSAAVEAQFPWGKLKSEKTPIESGEIEVNLASDKGFMDDMMTTVVSHTKEAAKAFASGNVSGMTLAAPSYQTRLKEVTDGLKSSSTYYKGTYLSTVFDLDSFRLYKEDGQWKTEVKGIEKHKSAYYDDYSAPELEENDNGYTYILVYSEGKKKWFVEKSEPEAVINIEHQKEIKNDNPKEYTSAWASAKGAVNNASADEELTDQKVASAIETYLYGLQDAINTNNFGLVRDSLKEGSPLYNDQKKLVAKLYNSGTQEEVADFSVKSWQQNGREATIQTTEKINIIKGGKEQVKTYHWTYHAAIEDGRLLLTSIE
ncbi:zinc ribbon domain-containing protein [Bacillus haynesii]|uniref:zinc ribbon domain-containing protein n=1 Tax=Bacillus haynesii TaxID=1925021 RepID=UPI002DBC7D20|nr:zinc ribbon domain-containing protein [Bacillus haynesii]MEC1447355.1 zinc ribbon domain-containing protein [Bacillus haynesii]